MVEFFADLGDSSLFLPKNLDFGWENKFPSILIILPELVDFLEDWQGGLPFCPEF